MERLLFNGLFMIMIFLQLSLETLCIDILAFRERASLFAKPRSTDALTDRVTEDPSSGT